MRYSLILCVILLVGCGQKTNQESTVQESARDTSEVITEGQKIAQAAFKTLSSNLQKAMAEGGVSHALQFCKVEAIPLTDSLSKQYNVELQRVSHRPRNPYNRADSLEMKTINKYIDQIKTEAKLKPVVYSLGHEITFHAPIRISNALCLSCHGKPGVDITNADLKTIEQFYPQDQAKGFEMGELRGIWTIRFPKAYFE